MKCLRSRHQGRRFASGKHGVNVVGYIRAQMGLGEAARALARAFSAIDFPFQVFNVEAGNPSEHTDFSWAHKEGSGKPYDITVVTLDPDNLSEILRLLPPRMYRNRYTIAYWFWELSEIPDRWLEAMDCIDEIWVASRFVQDAFCAKAPVPVYRVPIAVQLVTGMGTRRQDFRLPSDRFLFLTACDTRSYLERKNPIGTLRAFKKAFPPSRKDVGLVLKINNPEYRGEYLEQMLAEAGEHPGVYLIEEVMSRERMNGLLSCCDSFVSLHRSEGFGLGPAEAMSLGKPVIVTNWSGNTDYMHSGNAAGVNYSLTKLGTDFGPYQAEQFWAEPDLEHAAYWMRRLVEEPSIAAKMGREGQTTVRELLSPSAIGRRMERRLDYIRGFAL